MKRTLITLCGLLLAVPGAYAADAEKTTSAKAGASLFKSNCLACHGAEGKGDGPSGRYLPTRPANLSLSKAPDDYLKLIITEGGDAMGRSAAMPAWGAALTSTDIESIILHINTLRPPLN
jgi:mono/diheme cytochrome c family protein